MSTHNARGRRGRHLAGAAAVMATMAVTFATVTPATAAEVDQIGDCVFVADPTPENHTVCAGEDLGPDQGSIAGLNLDYADFRGSDLQRSDFISLASSTRHLQLNGALLQSAQLNGVDLRGSSMVGASIDYTDLRESNLAGVDFTDASLAGVKITYADLRDANFSGATFSEDATLEDNNMVGVNLTGTTLPMMLIRNDFTGVDFTPLAGGVIEAAFLSSNITDAKFDGLEIHGLNLDDVDALRASFKGATFAPGAGLIMRLSSFVETDFSGIDMTPVDYHDVSGNVFAYTNLEGTNLLVGNDNYFSHAKMRGAGLFGFARTSQFVDSDMRDVTFLYGLRPYDSRLASSAARASGDIGLDVNLRDSQFVNTDLSGANLDRTSLQEVTFYKTNLTGASIQADSLKSLESYFIDSDLTDATLPPAVNAAGWVDGEWVGDVLIQNTPVQGTSLVTKDVTAKTSGTAPVKVNFDLPVALRNEDGQLPYGDDYDKSYWGGVHNVCDHDSGELFPVGVTTVTCELSTDQVVSRVMPTRRAAPVDASVPDMSTLEVYENWDASWQGDMSGFPVPGMSPAKYDSIARGTTLAEIPRVNDAYHSFDRQGLTRGIRLYKSFVDAKSATKTSFTVTVSTGTATPPAISGKVVNGVAGAPYPERQLELEGNPTVTLKSGVLPKGLQLSTTGLISGTPAAGTGGRYDFIVEARNADGVADASFSLWIVEPAVDVSYDAPLQVDDQVDVAGKGFTPNGKVEVWLHSTPKKVATITADAFGEVTTATAIATAGVHHFELVDVTTAAVGVSDEFTVAGPAAADEPEDGQLAYTGVEIVAPIVLGTLLLAAGGILLVVRRRRKAVQTA